MKARVPSLAQRNLQTADYNAAQWRNLTRSRARAQRSENAASPNSTRSTDALREGAKTGTGPTFARQEWKRLLAIAKHADNDDTSDESDDDQSLTPAQKEMLQEKKQEEKKKREGYARTMGLEYFLEMVDEKHRYGSHLRAYHASVCWLQRS